MSLDFKVSVLGSSSSSSSSAIYTLAELQAKIGQGKHMVIDLWHTKCTKCPAALEHLNEEASSSDDVVYVACALSLGDGNKDIVTDLVSDWENLTHVFMEIDEKEAAKAAFGFTQVPYYIIIDKNGTLVGSGEPSKTDYISILAKSNTMVSTIQENIPQNIAPSPSVVPQNVFTLNEDF